MSKRYNLNFDWFYIPEFQPEFTTKTYDHTSWEAVKIPHSNVELPYNYFDEKDYQIESCYRKVISIPKTTENKRWILHFDGVMVQAKVYINGNYIGEHQGGYTPFAFDITDEITSGEDCVLTVYVDAKEDPHVPPFGFVVDYLTYGGIYREVWLEEKDMIYIENCHVITKNVLKQDKEVELDLFVKNHAKVNECALEVTIKNDDGIVTTKERTLKLSGNVDEQIKTKFTLNQPVLLWDIDHPNLYDIEISLKVDNISDTYHIRTGFREVEYKVDGFYLNGKLIKLRGLNRHQSFPYVGYAMPKSAQYADADILKNELGLNVVRSSHYPPSDHFLNRCDEIGLLVFDEIPGWQHIGAEGKWWDLTLQNVEEMIKKDWNHPSIFIWGVRINESQDEDELYAKTNALARKMDASRPTGGVRCIGGSNMLEDVYTYNDFVHEGGAVILDSRKKIAKAKVPYLVTEYNGHMFPTKRFDPQARRVEHALRHLRVVNQMMEDSEISGAIGWCMADYNTHQEFGSGDKICYHGVLDMYRIPKYAAAVYSAEGKKEPVMEVISSMDNGDMDKSIRGEVVVLSNCDYVKMYINGTYIKDFYPRKDLYKGVNHPPIIIDDFIGNQIAENEKFTDKDAKTIKKLLTKVDSEGENLPFLDMLKMGRLFFKYKMNMQDASDLYTKYFGGWGSASTEYRFEGYKDGECVIIKNKSQVFKPKLVLTVDQKTLVEAETFDTVRAVVNLVDEFGEHCAYASDSFIVETTAGIEVIGPKNLSLIGGSIGFWVKTTGISEMSKITINSERFGQVQATIEVIKKESLSL